MPKFPLTVAGTRAVFKSKWSAKELKIPAWVINAVIWITMIRAFAYGIELLLIVTSNPISPMMAFAAVLGIQFWGALMLISLAVLLIGLLTRRSIIVTFGALLCAAVWSCFALVLGIGWIDLGTGGRFFIAAAATAATFGILFRVQLNTYRKAGIRE